MANPVLDLPHGMETWRRFTVLDLFLLQLGTAIGFSAAAALRPFVDGDWSFVVVVGAILGPILCGPIVLFVQWFFRGRKERLSTGEWLWLSPFLIHLPALLFAILFAWSPIAVPVVFVTIFVVWLTAQVICVGAAGMVILSILGRTRPSVPCVWTDRVGAVIGLLSNLLLCPGLLSASLEG